MEFRCLCLCEESEESAMRMGMAQFSAQAQLCVVPEWYRLREGLLYRLRNGPYDLVVVALRGALGMEAVLGVREKAPRVPLIWCSDDDVFALQSYRLRVTVFLRLPVNAQQVSGALHRCVEDREAGGAWQEEEERKGSKPCWPRPVGRDGERRRR